MGGPEKGLYDYLQILKSPEVYPDIAGAGFMLSPILHVISSIVAYLGIIAMFFVIIRIGVDVFLMAGAGNFITAGADVGNGKKFKSGLLKLSSFYGVKEGVPVGDVREYLANYGVKIILMLVFIGIMISGQMLPLAGTITATTGTIITRVANINPAPYLESIGLTTDIINKSIGRASISKKMSEYGNYTSNLTAVRQRLKNPEELSEAEYKELVKAYYNSYWAAEIYAKQLEKDLQDAREKSQKDEGIAMSNEEKKLRSFDTNAHRVNVDRALLDKGVECGGDHTLETRAGDNSATNKKQ